MSPMFNPAAMMPGAMHPSLRKPVERSESVDFEQPADANVIESTTVTKVCLRKCGSVVDRMCSSVKPRFKVDFGDRKKSTLYQ